MTLEQTTQRRPKKIDINFLPAEYQPHKVSRLNIALIALTVLLVCLPIAILALKASVNAASDELKAEYSEHEARRSELYVIAEEGRVIISETEAREAKLEAMQEDYLTFQNDIRYWSDIVQEIDDLIYGKRVTLSDINQVPDGVSLSGIATKRLYALDYALALEDSDYFEDVDIRFGDCPEGELCQFSINAPFTIPEEVDDQ